MAKFKNRKNQIICEVNSLDIELINKYKKTNVRFAIYNHFYINNKSHKNYNNKSEYSIFEFSSDETSFFKSVVEYSSVEISLILSLSSLLWGNL